MASLYDTVAAALVVFSEVLANPKELTPQLVRAWELTLAAAGVKPEQVNPAVARLLASQTFFPTPADFLKVINPPEDQDAAAELAWQQVLECVSTVGIYGTLTAADLNGDQQALWAVKSLGWSEICEGDPRQRAITRASFIRAYQAARSAGKATARVPGLHELKNDADGLDLTPELIGRGSASALPTATAKALPAPACSECGSRGRRHLLWCSTLGHLDKPKALPTGEVEGFAAVSAAMPTLKAQESSRPALVLVPGVTSEESGHEPD